MKYKIGDLVKVMVMVSEWIGITLYIGEITACHQDGTYDIGPYAGWREDNLYLVKSATASEAPAQDYLDLFT